jgi:DNA topoisomerase-1
MPKASPERALVIVESPTKAKTISRFLGKDFVVKASNGHIRDLPNSASEIPAKLRKEPWARLGVNVEKDFEPLYVISPQKKDHVKDLKSALKDVDRLYFATDEDREGESISWHLLQALDPKVPISRLVFHEITKEAIDHALGAAREIDTNLVSAQETRRIVDRLFGYEVSPLLWKKMLPKLSAGRVQSVAVRLLVERERERIRFRRAGYWSLKTAFAKSENGKESTPFEADLTHVGENRVATGKDFDPNSGELKTKEGVVALDEAAAKQLEAEVRDGKATVFSVDETPYSTAPAAPFVTSTLQQDANRQLRFSARHTMGLAQQLYENGFITYMRTDSTTLSEEALGAARKLILAEFGKQYLPDEPRQYKTKVRNAQEAHEAIRPAGDTFKPVSAVQGQLGVEAAKLYDMIWKRAVASQMPNATGSNIAVAIQSGSARFRATGKTVEFPGYLRAHVHGSKDPEAELASREKLLPKLAEREPVTAKTCEALERNTQPPGRYTEGSLIKELERLGIGRPSTWATIVDLVLSRSYAFKKGTALVPTFTAMAVAGLLEKHFTKLLDYEFTARLEDDLDAISRGEADRLTYLRGFYYGNGHRGLRDLVKEGETTIDPREVCGLPIGEKDGKLIEVRIGRYGPFLTDGEARASVPDMQAPDEMTIEAAMVLLEAAQKEPEALGDDPETNQPVYLKTGRYGPYVQLGDASDGEKPKMASLLRNMQPDDVDLALALKLLSLPRTLGEHPDDKAPVIATNGRFGPYVKWGSEIRSIPADGSPLEITLEQAVELLKQPKGRGRTVRAEKLKELGQHPISDLPIVILSGRYGPYVTDGTLNASLPRGAMPDKVTMDEAVNLLEARAARVAEEPNGGGGRRRVAKKATKKKATKKKAAKPKAKAKQRAGVSSDD